MNLTPFALQHTPPPRRSTGSGGGRELRDGSPPSTVCLLLGPPPYPLGLRATSAGMQPPQSPPTVQAELGGFTLGQVHPISNSFPLPPTLCKGSREPEMGDRPGPLCSRWFMASGWVGTCSLETHLLPAGMESKVVRERGRRSGVLPTLPSQGLWPRKWGKGRREKSSSSWDPREPELSCKKLPAQIHHVLPTPRPFIELRQDRLPGFSCASACENPDVCGPRELGACVYACTHVDV